jgi:hypothetical protein
LGVLCQLLLAVEKILVMLLMLQVERHTLFKVELLLLAPDRLWPTAIVPWLLLLLLWPEIGHVLQPFVSAFSALKDVPLQLVAPVVVDVTHIVTVLLPRGQEYRGAKRQL